MRRRSGAFHCDSEEDFVQLAEVAHNQIGIFYDERANKKVMHQMKSHSINSQSLTDHKISNPEHSAQKNKINYSGFQFGLENQADKQERLELQRSNEQVKTCQTIALICQNISGIIQKIFGVKNWDTTNMKSAINLFQKRIDYQNFKFWILSKAQLQNGNQILSLYLRKSNIVLSVINNELTISRNSSNMSDSQILSLFII